MKILVTGAYGFVGTNLCRYLVERGHVCDALDIPGAKRSDVPYRAFCTWDDLSSSPSSSPSPLSFTSYDAVVHLAGKAHDLKKVASEQSYFDVNVGLTQRIFKALSQQVKGGDEKVKGSGEGEQRKITFIYFSSSKASAMGNAYGRSKLAAEEYLTSAVHLSPSPLPSPSPLRVVILRPAMIHGPGNKGNLNLLWGIARRGLPWPLAAFENKRSFTSIGNICAAVEKLADPSLNTHHSSLNTYFVADDEMLSTNRLIELIAETCGKKAKLWRVPKGLMRLAAKVGDVLHLPLNTERIEKLTEDSFVDNAALKKALGWDRMPIQAEEGMRRTLKSFLAV